MANLIYDVIRTEFFEKTYFSIYFIVSMFQCKKETKPATQIFLSSRK